MVSTSASVCSLTERSACFAAAFVLFVFSQVSFIIGGQVAEFFPA